MATAQRKLEAQRAKADAYDWLQRLAGSGKFSKGEILAWQQQVASCRSLADAVGIKDILVGLGNEATNPLHDRVAQLERDNADLEGQLRFAAKAIESL